jgi:hypothetical protein
MNMARHFLGLIWLLAALLNAGCGGAPCRCGEPASSASTAASTASTGDRSANAIQASNINLVGVWRGYWSPSKGKVETERYLFLSDGRWGWLAMGKDLGCMERGIAQRSGTWSFRGEKLVLEERERREVVGCKDARPTPSEKSPMAGGANATTCSEPELSAVRHTEAVVETVPIGQCPPNQEAETQDQSYTCVSIAGKAFWRQAEPENVDKEAFLGDK